jgi:hypothetical protein
MESSTACIHRAYQRLCPSLCFSALEALCSKVTLAFDFFCYFCTLSEDDGASERELQVWTGVYSIERVEWWGCGEKKSDEKRGCKVD